jgi:Fur family ferric uptake transcriptional regulator
METSTERMCEGLLTRHHYRVTRARVLLLTFLYRAKKPLTVKEIRQSIAIDKVTLYRALEDFVASRIVMKLNLYDDVSHYELVHTGHHHHHVVCEHCGAIEDIELCEQKDLEKSVLKESKHFSIVTSHALEFFGICKSCARNKVY